MTVMITQDEKQQIKQLWNSGVHNKSEIGRRLGHTSGWVVDSLAVLGLNNFDSHEGINEMASKIQVTLAHNLRYFMDRDHLTNRKLKELTGLGDMTICGALKANGKQGVSITAVGKLANAIGVTPGDLVDDWMEVEDDTDSLQKG